LEGWAAVKITPSPLFSSISLHDPSTDPSGKDTGRLYRAGADPVIHLRVPHGELGEGLRQAADMVPPDRSLLIEGKGALEILEPDLSVLVWRTGQKGQKGSFENLAAGAELVFINEDANRVGDTPCGESLPSGGRVIRGCLREILDHSLMAELADVLKEKGIF